MRPPQMSVYSAATRSSPDDYGLHPGRGRRFAFRRVPDTVAMHCVAVDEVGVTENVVRKPSGTL